MYENIIKIIVKYDSPMDIFVGLYQYIYENEGKFSNAINDSDNDGLFLNDDCDETFQLELNKCVKSVLRSNELFKQLLLEICTEYKNDIDKVVCRFMMHFDKIIGREVLEKNNSIKSRKGFYVVEPLNRETKSVGLLHLSSRLYQLNDYRVGRVIEERGCATEKLLECFGIAQKHKDYEVSISMCTDDRIKQLGFLDTDEINVAMSHFTSEPVFNFEKFGNMFKIDGLKDEEYILEKLKTTLLHMSSNSVDVALFPEMLFTNKILKEIRLFLAQLPFNNLKMIVLGSIWSNRLNKSVVLSGKGNVVHEQLKMNNFHLNADFSIEGCNEDICLSNRDIKLLDINGFGRISNLICVDLIIDDIFDNLKNIGVSYFFSPVYTSTIDTMSDYASMRYKNYGAITFISNCCHALSKCESFKREPSFFIDVGKDKPDDVIIRTENCFKDLNNRVCDYKVCYNHILIKNKKVDSHTPVRVK